MSLLTRPGIDRGQHVLALPVAPFGPGRVNNDFGTRRGFFVTCSIDGCERYVVARGWCSSHYRRWKRHESPTGGQPMRNTPPRYDPEDRPWRCFWRHVEFTETCWLWTGSLLKGYGICNLPGNRQSHRYAYEFCVGPIPEGLHIDHLCRVPHCVNPDHMEPVTNRENILRSPIAPSAINARKTHCIRGHEFTPENTYFSLKRQRNLRGCRTCKREYQRRRYTIERLLAALFPKAQP